MRIEIDQELAKVLDDIKNREPVIYGRGHVETVRFLANYYRRHRPLEELLNDLKAAMEKFLGDLDLNLELALERVIFKAITGAVIGILKAADENQPDVRSGSARRQPGEGR